MSDGKLYQFVLLMACLLLGACQAQEPVIVTEQSKGIELPAATAAVVPSATPTAVLSTSTASPLPPTTAPPTATQPAPPTPAAAPTNTPALTYECPIEPPAAADDAAAAGAPLRVAFIAEDGIQLWDEISDTTHSRHWWRIVSPAMPVLAPRPCMKWQPCLEWLQAQAQ